MSKHNRNSVHHLIPRMNDDWTRFTENKINKEIIKAGNVINDIAKMIGRTSSAVKMRLQKGRKLLAEAYQKEWT